MTLRGSGGQVCDASYDVLRNWYVDHVGRRLGRRGGQPQRHPPAPHAARLDVCLVIGGVASPTLDRRLVQRQGEHGRRGELLAGRPAQGGGTTRGDVVDEQVERVSPLLRVGHRSWSP